MPELVARTHSGIKQLLTSTCGAVHEQTSEHTDEILDFFEATLDVAREAIHEQHPYVQQTLPAFNHTVQAGYATGNEARATQDNKDDSLQPTAAEDKADYKHRVELDKAGHIGKDEGQMAGSAGQGSAQAVPPEDGSTTGPLEALPDSEGATHGFQNDARHAGARSERDTDLELRGGPKGAHDSAVVSHSASGPAEQHDWLPESDAKGEADNGLAQPARKVAPDRDTSHVRHHHHAQQWYEPEPDMKQARKDVVPEDGQQQHFWEGKEDDLHQGHPSSTWESNEPRSLGDLQGGAYDSQHAAHSAPRHMGGEVEPSKGESIAVEEATELSNALSRRSQTYADPGLQVADAGHMHPPVDGRQVASGSPTRRAHIDLLHKPITNGAEDGNQWIEGKSASRHHHSHRHSFQEEPE